MKFKKEEIKLANGFNQFNLVDEKNLIVGVVAGFSNERNLKNATLLENAPELLSALKQCISTIKAMEIEIKNSQGVSYVDSVFTDKIDSLIKTVS
jgi:hypothetical protein